MPPCRQSASILTVALPSLLLLLLVVLLLPVSTASEPAPKKQPAADSTAGSSGGAAASKPQSEQQQKDQQQPGSEKRRANDFVLDTDAESEDEVDLDADEVDDQQRQQQSETQARIQAMIDEAVMKHEEKVREQKQLKQKQPGPAEKASTPVEDSVKKEEAHSSEAPSKKQPPPPPPEDKKEEEAAADPAAPPSGEAAGDPEAEQQKFMSEDEIRAQQLFQDGQKILNSTKYASNSGLLNKAFQYISQAAALNHTKAMEMSGLAYLFGEGLRQNLGEARRLFERLAELGNPRGQLGLAFLHAHSLGGGGQDFAASPAKALLYLTFSAIGGDPYGQMALAYRYWAGVGVETNCETALMYYQQVARLVADKVKPWSSPAIHRVRLLDEEDGPNAQSGTLDDDLIQYYQFLADKGDVNAQVGLGQLYFQGGRGVPVNHQMALGYFKMAAQAGNANAMAYLGKMYAGDSTAVVANNRTALHYFTSAAQNGNAIGYAGLGLMHLQGRGVAASAQKAEEFFGRSAELGYAEGQLQLGLMHLVGSTQAGVKDLKKAVKYFTLASQQGNTLAFYYLAQMHAAGSGVLRSCQTAAELYKNVAERGRWSELLMEAHRLYKEGARYGALLRYLFLADMGYEAAQSNAAFILDQTPEALFPANESYARARRLWSQAAGQSYAAARLKLADYHYYGLGGPANLEQAASLYRAASEQQSSAQAMFNLAYMYEHGLGLQRDIHLAKRYYDQAAETNAEAYVPVMLALGRLAMSFIAEYLTSGNYSLTDLFSILSFSNFWPSVASPSQQQQQPHHPHSGAEPDAAEADSAAAAASRQQQLGGGARSWDSLLLTVSVGVFVYLLIGLLNRAANRREGAAGAPAAAPGAGGPGPADVAADGAAPPHQQGGN